MEGDVVVDSVGTTGTRETRQQAADQEMEQVVGDAVDEDVEGQPGQGDVEGFFMEETLETLGDADEPYEDMVFGEEEEAKPNDPAATRIMNVSNILNAWDREDQMEQTEGASEDGGGHRRAAGAVAAAEVY